MAELNTSVPEWLQRNWVPEPGFDPTPWLQERYRRQVEQQKLPLELQGMALANEAHRLAVEHQGVLNETAGLELNQYKSELPIINDYLSRASTTPGGSMAIPIPNGIRSKMGMDTLLNRQKIDADTAYGISLKQRIIDQTKRAASLPLVPGGSIPRPRADGTFDEAELGSAEQAALAWKQRNEIEQDAAKIAAQEAAKEQSAQANQPRELERIRTRAQAEAEAKQIFERDPALAAGIDLAKAKESLLQSKQATNKIAESTPELEAELSRQRQLQTVIDSMESKQKRSPGTLAEKMASVTDLNAAVDAAANSGDPNALQDATERRDAMEALLYPKGTKIQASDPITGNPMTRVVGGTTTAEDEMTAKTRSSLQQQVQGSIQAAKILHDLQQKVDWTTVGPGAYVAEKLGRFGPGSLLGLSSESGAAGRAEIRGAKMDIMQQMERAGHSSTAVMKTIESTLPSLGFFESPSAAQSAVAERKRSSILEGLNAARQLNQKPPGELIQLLSTYKSTELKRMVNTGLLRPEDALAAYTLQQAGPGRTPTNTPVADWVKH